ncbi:MAG TPA: hypothetical protein VLW45_05850 [Pelomicrobium sp.]|nr:hypothetical protein [Pelomicrobium sp.]
MSLSLNDLVARVGAPLRREGLRIGLAPDRVELARGTGGNGEARAAEIACAAAVDAPPWRPALDALRAALPDWARGAKRAHVILSNHFVRYVLVPWNEQVVRPAERRLQARNLLAATFGGTVAGWEIALAEPGYGEPALACATDGALLDALTAVLESARLRVDSVRPYLVAAYNAASGQLDANGCLAVAEPGRLSLAAFSGGRWGAVSSRRVASADALGGSLLQELTLLDLSAAPASVALGGAGRCAMAMCGARP